MKKWLAFCLTLVMVFSLMAAPAGAIEVTNKADADVVITVGSGTISETGTTLDVPVTVEFVDANAKFDAFGLQFSFDSSNIVMSPSTGETDPVVKCDATTLCDTVSASADGKKVSYADASGFGIDKAYAEQKGSNVLFYLRFDAMEGYVDGDYTVDVDIIGGETGNFAYHSQGVDVCFVPGTITLTSKVVIETTPMYRLYNPNSGEHFYTGSAEERDFLASLGWQYEGIAWNAPVEGGEAIHRLFNPNNGDHHYSASQEEIDMLVSVGWRYEGIAWNSAGDIPQYRLFNPNADCGSHHYTGSIEERDFLVSLGWHYEGIGWYGLA